MDASPAQAGLEPPPLKAGAGSVGARGGFLDWLSVDTERGMVRELEALGYESVWIPEATGKEAFSHAAILLAATRRITVATGIASIWARDATAMANGCKTLDDAFPGRFTLGLGVSHRTLVEARGHRYDRPYATLAVYLDAMTAAPYRARPPICSAPMVLGALGPRSIALAAERGLGVHSFFVPVEHTRRSREQLKDGWLAPEVAFVLSSSRKQARRAAEAYMRTHLALPNYRRNLESLGWDADDFDGNGSDALFDALVAWGDASSVRELADQHIAAGASGVVLNAVAPETARSEAMDSLRAVAGSFDPCLSGSRETPAVILHPCRARVDNETQ